MEKSSDKFPLCRGWVPRPVQFPSKKIRAVLAARIKIVHCQLSIALHFQFSMPFTTVRPYLRSVSTAFAISSGVVSVWGRVQAIPRLS